MKTTKFFIENMPNAEGEIKLLKTFTTAVSYYYDFRSREPLPDNFRNVELSTVAWMHRTFLDAFSDMRQGIERGSFETTPDVFFWQGEEFATAVIETILDIFDCYYNECGDFETFPDHSFFCQLRKAMIQYVGAVHLLPDTITNVTDKVVPRPIKTPKKPLIKIEKLDGLQKQSFV
ncbi:hypothetical protein [Dyadobacter sp. CY351]|uniref:hypothetical protein n=1 Tax=Dyadobacter sp. CY351 TaxID=2909337 RepID=UPI001F17A2B6|nr:hypothetical protein [Dyadobacter sp. CY351]MCF2517146.1 hypothetical protein [Dyadobacter sp. CY351]